MAHVRGHEFLKNYGLQVFAWITLFPLLALPEVSYGVAFLQGLFLLCWIFFGHWIQHQWSDGGPLQHINPHIFIHHRNVYDVPRWFNLTVELVFDLLCIWFIFPVMWLLAPGILSTSMILGVSFAYVFYHIFDWSIFGNDTHKLHHTDVNCNYGPDFMDVLFGTRCNDTLSYDQSDHEVLHILAAVALGFYVKQRFGLS